MKVIKYILSGVSIGIANIIPGISGGTMAVILGIYDRLICSLVDLIQFRNMRQSLLFIIPIGVGALIGIKGFASVILIALELYYVPTQLFWIGLILGSLPSIATSFKCHTLRANEWMILGGCFLLLVGIDYLTIEGSSIMSPSIWMFFGMGAIAAAAMVLPGLSGSLVMMIVGMYTPILIAIDTGDIATILIVGAGAVVGGLSAITGVKWLLGHYQRPTHAAIMGLVLGSVPVLCPEWQIVLHSFPSAMLALGVGTGMSALFCRYK
jgi:putative membrane protein